MITKEMKQYARYLLTSNKRLCIVVWLSMFVVIPFLLGVLETTGGKSEPFIVYTVFLGFALACIAPIYLYRFIYQKRSSDLYFSLPIKRTQVFLVIFFTGYLLILAAVIINIIAIISLLGTELSVFHMILYIGKMSVMLFVFYAIVTWVVQQCNNLLDSIFINFCYLFIPLLFIGAFSIFMNQQYALFMIGEGSFAQEVPFVEDVAKMISVVYAMIVTNIMDPRSRILVDLWVIGYWFVIGFICMWFANKNFMKRKQEDSEQRTSTWWTYPLIIGSTIFCFILIMGNVNMPIDIMVTSSVSIFILYICMIFFSKRKIQLSRRAVILFIVLYASCFIFSGIFQTTKGFGLVKEIPNIANVKEVEISIYSTQYDENSSTHILPMKVQYIGEDKKEKEMTLNNLYVSSKKSSDIEMLIDTQKHISKITKGYNNKIDYFITLKNGSKITREYNVTEDTAIEQVEAMINSNAKGDTSYKLNYSLNENSENE